MRFLTRWLPERLANPRRRPARLGFETLESRDNPSLVVAGAAAGSASIATVFDSDTSNLVFQQDVFPGFTGGVRVASADFTGDGVPELVAAAGEGGGPRVRIINPVTKLSIANSIGDFFPFESEFTGGVFVAVANLDGDTVPDLICAAGEGGGPRVRAYSGADGLQLADFFAYAPNMM